MENKILNRRIPRTRLEIILVLFFLLICSQVFSQNSYTFTNASAIGTTGPTQSSVNAAYLSTNLNGSVTVIGNGVQQWTVPASDMYRIQAIGASGGSAYISCTVAAGLGANISGDFSLTVGQVIKVLVGQRGGTNGYNSGGGGGSYVTTSNSVALVVAGGGGGCFNQVGNCPPNINSINASITTSATAGGWGGGAGGVNGNGGVLSGGFGTGGAGGGMFTNGGGGTWGGMAFINGATGGDNLLGSNDYGGYGGGGDGWSQGVNGGGGGGYSGGGASSLGGAGGGGGSYNSGTNPTNTLATLPGDGKVIITRLCGITITNIGSNPICSGTSLTLTTNASNNYTWNTGSSSSSIVISPTVTTTYTLIGTNSVNCIGTAAVTITVDIPNMGLTSSSASICAGQTATLAISNPSTNVVYSWSTANSGTSISVSPSVTSTFSVIGTNSISGCSNSNTIDLQVYDASFSVTSPSAICVGETATLNAIGFPNNYSWTASGGTSAASVAVSPTTTTNYSITGSVNGCSVMNTFSIIVNPLPDLNITSTPTIACNGQSVALAVSNPSNNIYYTWSTPNSGTSVSVNPTITTVYTVSATDSISGCLNSNSISLSAFNSTFVVTGPSSICKGATTTLNALGSGSTYSWTANGGVSSASVQISPTTTTAFTVTSNTNGCSDTKVFTLVVNPPPSLIAQTVRGNICVFETSTLTASGASSYSWNNGAVSPTINVTLSVTTTYTVTGTDLLGCSNTASVTQIVETCTDTDSQPHDGDDFTIFPNPNNGTFIIRTKFIMPLHILNSVGQIIVSIDFSDRLENEPIISNLPNGLYVLIGQSGEKCVSRKFLVEKP